MAGHIFVQQVVLGGCLQTTKVTDVKEASQEEKSKEEFKAEVGVAVQTVGMAVSHTTLGLYINGAPGLRRRWKHESITRESGWQRAREVKFEPDRVDVIRGYRRKYTLGVKVSALYPLI